MENKKAIVFVKQPGKNSGRSKSKEFPKGKRRMLLGKERAPKSARRKGRTFLTECSAEDLKKAEV